MLFGTSFCSYNPRFTDTISGMQAGIAGLNGIANIFEAKNRGASTVDAIQYGLNNASAGIGNALLGNVIDKTTHTYLGTTFNNVLPTLTGGNPYLGTAALSNSLLATTMMNPYMGWASPMFTTPMMMPMMGTMSFGNHMMYGMPRFGGFCCHC